MRCAVLAGLLLSLTPLLGCEIVREGPRPRWQVPISPMPEPPGPIERHVDVAWPAGDTATSRLIELGGRIGADRGARRHIVLTLDMSGSVFEPTGVDVDADGITGVACERSCRSGLRGRTTDFDDTVVSAELRAARSLVGLLDAESTRMGMVKYGSVPWVERRVGDLDALLDAIEGFRFLNRGSSDLVGGIHRSIDLLEDASADPEIDRVVLLLSDGQLIVPWDRLSEDMQRRVGRDIRLHCGHVEGSHDACSSAAIAKVLNQYLDTAIARARLTRTRVFAFGVGANEEGQEALLRRIAEETGGRYQGVKASSDILLELPFVDLVGLSHVEMENQTTGEPGRAIRVFPDGSFDGVLSLVRGRNALRVRAVLAGGETLEDVREITYDGVSDPRADEAILRMLAERTIETDLARRIQVERRRRQIEKSLEIEIAPAP